MIVKKEFCYSCQKETNCEVCGTCQNVYTHEVAGNFYEDWELFKCRGCDAIFIKKIEYSDLSAEPYYDSEGEVKYHLNPTIIRWPNSGYFSINQQIREFVEFNNDDLFIALNTMLNEVCVCGNIGAFISSAIGVRTCFELCYKILKLPENTTFAQKLETLEKKNHINRAEKINLKVLIDAGNASAHQGWQPDFESISTIIIELQRFILNTFIIGKQLEDHSAAIKGVSAKIPKKQKQTPN